MNDVAARAAGDPTGAPDTSISPPLRSSMPAARRRNVDFPEPLWPTSATRSPGAIDRVSGASATRSA